MKKTTQNQAKNLANLALTKLSHLPLKNLYQYWICLITKDSKSSGNLYYLYTPINTLVKGVKVC